MKKKLAILAVICLALSGCYGIAVEGTYHPYGYYDTIIYEECPPVYYPPVYHPTYRNHGYHGRSDRGYTGHRSHDYRGRGGSNRGR